MKILRNRNPGGLPSQKTMHKAGTLLRFLSRIKFPNSTGMNFRDKYWIYFDK